MRRESHKESKLAKDVGFNRNIVKTIEHSLANNIIEKQWGQLDDLYLTQLREEAINTSLSDFKEILKEASKRNQDRSITICDIGASYCKMAFVAEKFFPNIRVISIEPVKERIDYAKNILGKTKHTFINDYFSEKLVNENKIDYYFLYFPVSRALEEILYKIKKPVISIEAHGQLLNRLGHAYESKSQFTKLIMPRHNPMSYLFTGRSDSKDLMALKELKSNSNDLILINDQRPWYADKEGLETYYDDKKITIELQTPPRTIYFNQHLETIDSSKLDAEIQMLIYMRREGKKVDGCFIRKIFIDGSFELSSGEIRK